MNVKSFLAGKKGICPKCGVGVEVPLESAVGDQQPVQKTAPIAASHSQAATVEMPNFGPEIGDPIENSSAAGPWSTNGTAAFKSELPAAIAEDPQKLWYTCTKTGDRYGPVNGVALNKWINEGRVSSESLVWREGWPEWKRAAAVFPSLDPMGAFAGPPEDLFGYSPLAGIGSPLAGIGPTTPAKGKTDDLLSDAISASANTASTELAGPRHRTGKDKMVIMSMALIGAVTLLAVTLVLVLLNR